MKKLYLFVALIPLLTLVVHAQQPLQLSLTPGGGCGYYNGYSGADGLVMIRW